MHRLLHHPAALFAGIAMVIAGAVLVIDSATFQAWDYKRRHADAEACGPLKTEADVRREVDTINSLTKRHIGHQVVNGGAFWCVERAPWADDSGRIEWLASPMTDDLKAEIDRAIPR